MNAAALLVELRAAGIRIQPRPGGLRLSPKDRVSAELLEKVRRYKGDIIRLLGTPVPPAAAEPPPLPIDLIKIADAIGRSPRSPFLDDLAVATITRAAVAAQRAIAALPNAARPEALARCRQIEDQIVEAIRAHDYAGAYQIAARLAELPHEITELRPQ